MNNKKFISFLPYILVLGIMLLLISYGSEGNTKNFNYNEFMTKANTMTFTKAEMSMGTTVIDVKGSYSEKGKDVNFTVRVPNTEKNVSYLTDVFKKKQEYQFNSKRSKQGKPVNEIPDECVPVPADCRCGVLHVF